MSVLKSEIELFLLENNFSLIEDTASSKTMSVYKSKIFDWFLVFISSDSNDNFVVCYFETETKDCKKTHVDRMLLNTLDEFKFLATHCSRSPLFNDKLITSQVH